MNASFRRIFLNIGKCLKHGETSSSLVAHPAEGEVGIQWLKAYRFLKIGNRKGFPSFLVMKRLACLCQTLSFVIQRILLDLELFFLLMLI